MLFHESVRAKWLGWSMDWSGCDIVEVVPGKVSGVPLLKHSRVPADQVVDNHLSGESVSDIAENFGLEPKDVRKVLAYAASQKAVYRP